ncbi:MAG: helix-turn-helix transcriptional regulator [Desulfuromonadales bacterium]|nr:helix-turn-helix transcriptional regulator [Desulfuromonadales bacterium]
MKMEQDLTSKVQLDGSAIRRIREEQKLTQYYIAKVVGVTIDTVSRWENNRYPSVRRENALLLSEALGVPVESILLKARPVSAPRLTLKIYFIFAVVTLLLTLGLLFILRQSADVTYQLSVQRLLPPHTSLATKLPVTVSIDLVGAVEGMVLREDFSKGFKLVEATPPPSSLDNEFGSARWILRDLSESVRINYLLEPDLEFKIDDSLVFQGELIVKSKGENRSSAVLGETSIPINIYHWADANRDLVIDDSEALDASVLAMAMKNLDIDWALIEDIWDAGGYRLDSSSNKFIAARNKNRP